MVSVSAASPIDGISLAVSSPLTDPDTVTVAVTGHSASASDTSATVYVTMPDILFAPGVVADAVQCTPTCQYENDVSQGSTLFRSRFELQPKWHESAGESIFTASVSLNERLILRPPAGSSSVLSVPGMNCDQTDCRGSLPLVALDSDTQLTAGAEAEVRILYPVLKDYDWNESLTAYPNVDYGVDFNYPIGRWPTDGYLTQYPLDGTNLSAERSSSNHVFLSGILAAVAASLALAAVQDLLSTMRDRRRRDGSDNGHRSLPKQTASRSDSSKPH